MKKYLLPLLLLIGCSTASQISCPPPSVVTQIVYKYDTVSVTQTVVVRDTVAGKVIVDSLPTVLNIDTTHHLIKLSPTGADSYLELQAAANFEQAHGGYDIRLSCDIFYYSRTLIFAAPIANGYNDACAKMHGIAFAKNPIWGQVTRLIYTGDTGPGIIVQQGKSIDMEDFFLEGQYTKLNNLTPAQIDSMSADQWKDGIHSFNRSSPYAGICIDPFSDPKYFTGADSMYPGMAQYYIPGMSTSGSTVARISGVYVQNFVVGFMNSPGYQLNGEMINFDDCQLSYDFVGYAFSNAQQKMNFVRSLECWGQVYCLFDGTRFGIGHGDGSICPIVDGVNIAGAVNELMEHDAASFAVSMNHVYAEGLFRIGHLNAAQGANLENFNIDFQQDAEPTVPLVASPGLFFTGGGVTFNSCAFRLYNGNGWYNNLTFFGFGLMFRDGSMAAPIVGGYQTSGPFAPKFENVGQYYGIAPPDGKGTAYNTFASLGNKLLTVNRTNNTGFIIDSMNTSTAGDVLITWGWTRDYNPTYVDNLEVGSVLKVSGDTTYVAHVGVGLKDTTYAISVVKIKPQH